MNAANTDLPELMPYLGRAFARCHWASPARVLAVPPIAASGYRKEDLLPSASAMRSLATRLSSLTSRTVRVEPALYLPVAVIGTVVLDAEASGDAASVAHRLERFLHPVLGGTDGTGWPFGVAVRACDIADALAALPAVADVRDLSIRTVDLASPQRRGPERAAIELPATGLVFATEHDLRIVTAARVGRATPAS
jgi:hypothetical protein